MPTDMPAEHEGIIHGGDITADNTENIIRNTEEFYADLLMEQREQM